MNGLTHVHPVQMGISDKADNLTLSVPRINSGEASFGRLVYDDSYQVDCQVESLDNILGNKAVDFIKIDVEGFECYALKGARELIGKNRPTIFTEVVDEHLERSDSSRTDLIELMKAMEYIPFSVTLRRNGLRHGIILAPMSDEQFFEYPSGKDVLWVPAEKESFRSANRMPQ